MPPRRPRFELPSFFTFGGRIPASIGLVLVVTAVLTVYTWQNRAFAGLVALAPGGIVAGEVWRVVTWPFVQGDPFGLIFIALTFWWLAPQLMWGWGERRFWLRLLGITAGAAIVPTLLAFAWAGANVPHVGAWPVINAMLVAWAMRVPDAQLNIWGVLPVTARTLALFVVGGTVLYALFAGLGAFLPHFAAMAIGYAFERGLSAGRLIGRAQESFRQQQQRRRARHLKVVKKDGQGPPRWMN
jgi:hypothetical protein